MNEMERMTWTEFLSRCDISEWNWTFPLEENVVKETEDCWIVRIYLEDILDILDQQGIYWLEDEEGNIIVDWGIPTVIENPDDVPDIFVRIWKTPVHERYFSDGLFYFSIDETE